MYYQQSGVWQYDGLGDISRIQRDHEFLKVLATSVSSKGLDNPITDNDLIGAVAKDLTIDNTFSLGDLVDLAKTFSRVNVAAAPEATLSVDEDNSPNGFTFKGTQYGDIVFPTNTADQAAITAFVGQPLDGSGLSPSTLPVKVVNGSGVDAQATTVATQLRALGFSITSASTGPVNSSPAESVVYYAAGHEPAAQRLADELGGAVALGEDATIAGSGLTLLTGTNLTVAGPAPAAQASAPAPPAATAIGGITATDPSYPAFDPTACPAGTSATTPPTLPDPSSRDLPQT